MQIDSSIFKQYDIRGIYPDQLNEELIYKIAQAYAKLLHSENPGKKLKLVVAVDMRASSPSLSEKMIEGLLDSGVDVVDIGLSSTTVFYFAVAFYGYDGGMIVTASHNPKEYNGIKMSRRRAMPVSGENGIYQVRDWVVEDNFEKVAEKGSIEKKEGVLEEMVEKYSKMMDLSGIKSLKVVIDPANAMGILDLDEAFKKLNCELIKVNYELDGSFPNHEANPLKSETWEDGKKAILENKADLAILTDGDNDRIAFLDNEGQVINPEIIRGILAQIALKRSPGATVCYDIRPGKITRDMIEDAGGRPVITRVGHSLIKEKMLEEDAIFGGESSGHFFYKFEYGVFEAPVLVIFELLNYFSQFDKSVADIVRPMRKYFHSGEINRTLESRELIEKVVKKMAEKYADGEISYLDGITITYDNFWFNVRASNTEPKLRLNLEAIDKKTMEEKRDEVLALMKE